MIEIRGEEKFLFIFLNVNIFNELTKKKLKTRNLKKIKRKDNFF